MGNFLPTLGALDPNDPDQLSPWAGGQGWGILASARDHKIRELDGDQEVAPLSAVSQGTDAGFESAFCPER